MKCRLLCIALVLALAPDAVRLAAQRQDSPQPGGRQGAVAGRQGGAPPDGRQGGPARPARDRAAVQGTGVIRGRIVSAETGAPVRRAQVQAAFGGQRARVALTDTDGRFELRELPAGQVVLRATKTGFVAQQFGQRSPFSASDPVTLGEGQQFTADFALMRGGVITGHVFDEFGDPIANVRVSAQRSQFTPAGPRLTSGGGGPMTDDTGAYRLYGLAPGTYYISATPQGAGANVPLLAPGGPVTYAATYFPGTTDPGAAQRITLRAGQDQHNIDFGLILTPTVQVSGVVLGLGGTPIQATVNLRGALAADTAGAERRGVGTAADGSFIFPSVPPGNYVLEVTGRVRTRNVPPEVAAVPLVVAGSDITGLTVTTSRGATVSGTLATEDGTRVEFGAVRVTAAPVRANGWTPRATVTDAAFALGGIIGPYTLRFDQLPSGWIVKSVTAGPIDITDTPLDFRGTEQVSVRVLLTDRVLQVTGTVRSDASPRGAGVLVFPDNSAKWTPTSRSIRTARAGDAGQFTIGGLPGDERYLAVAVEYLESGEHLDPDFLNRLRPLATSVPSGNGQPHHLELPLRARP